MKTVMTVFGTRPEAIKMAPLVKELGRHPDKIKPLVALSAQHREMLDQVLDIFDIKSDYDMNIMSKNQSLSKITTSVISKMEEILQKEKVDLIIVQGDTTTTFAAALTGFYHKIPIGHVEAGLRTHDIYYPFPEELNRIMTTRLTTFNWVPTELSRQNLLREGIKESLIKITGNTVIDALLDIVNREGYGKLNTKSGRRQILVTAHRRESWGEPMEQICKALLHIVNKFEDTEIIFPVHLNPKVRETVFPLLGDHPRIQLLDPLGYKDFSRRIAESYLILTDSGGIQEEAPSLGKPVLVLRNETERQEAVDAGTARLVGPNFEKIIHQAQILLTDINEYEKMSKAVNPYGDGTASKQIVQHILENL